MSFRIQNRWRSQGCAAMAAALLLVPGFVDLAFGQAASPFGASLQVDPNTGYKFIQVFSAFDTRMPEGIEDPAALRDERKKLGVRRKARGDMTTRVKQMLRGETGLNRQQFTSWFNLVVFAEMTQLDNESLSSLPDNRKRFIREYLQEKNAPPQARNELTSVTGGSMLAIARDNFHPAVRYNAALIVGELNQREPRMIGGDKAYPIPLRGALRILLTEFQDPKQIDAVRVACMAGILRHAQIDGQLPPKDRMNFDERKPYIDAMLALIAAKDPPPGRSLGGHQWLQRRAIEILGAFRDPGASNNVATTLQRIVLDENELLSFRCTAAVAYGNLNFQPADLKASEAVRDLASLASFACTKELERLALQLEDLRQGMADAVPTPIENIPPEQAEGSFERYKVNLSRRLLKHYVACVKKGIGEEKRAARREDPSTLTGLYRYATEQADKEFVQKVLERLDAISSATDKNPKEGITDVNYRVLTSEVDLKLQELNMLLASVGGKPARGGAASPAGPGTQPADPGLPPGLPGLGGPGFGTP